VYRLGDFRFGEKKESPPILATESAGIGEPALGRAVIGQSMFYQSRR
jgi:hypothetical protein